MNTISAVAKNFVNLIYPLHCASCHRPLEATDRTGVCSLCVAEIKANPRPHCKICGHSMQDAAARCLECVRTRPSFTLSRSASLYEGVVKELIHTFKYGNRRLLAGLLTDLIAGLIKDDPSIAEGADLITFVPLHRSRIRDRGFNQSELIARRLSAILGLDAVGCLEKVRRTPNQNQLSRSERLDNLKEAFKPIGAVSELFSGKVILLVDDVMTTGATLEECSRTLLDAGAREVRCLTAARGI